MVHHNQNTLCITINLISLFLLIRSSFPWFTKNKVQYVKSEFDFQKTKNPDINPVLAFLFFCVFENKSSPPLLFFLSYRFGPTCTFFFFVCRFRLWLELILSKQHQARNFFRKNNNSGNVYFFNCIVSQPFFFCVPLSWAFHFWVLLFLRNTLLTPIPYTHTQMHTQPGNTNMLFFFISNLLATI